MCYCNSFLSFPTDAVCSDGYYECQNLNCIPQAYVNDTINDCVDNTDEGTCTLTALPVL